MAALRVAVPTHRTCTQFNVKMQGQGNWAGYIISYLHGIIYRTSIRVLYMCRNDPSYILGTLIGKKMVTVYPLEKNSPINI